MSSRKKFLFFFLVFVFFLSFLTPYFSQAFSSPYFYQPQGKIVTNVQNISKLPLGDEDSFLVNFCHINPESEEYKDGWLAVKGSVKKLRDIVFCLFLYIASLPVRFIFLIIIIFFWVLVWLVAFLGDIVSVVFVMTLSVSFQSELLNPANIQGVGELWNFSKTVGNALVLLAGVFIGFATAAGLQEYHIKKHFGKLIALAILVNYSHWLVILAADTSNKIAKPFFDYLTGTQGEERLKSVYIISQIWNNQNKKSIVNIEVPYGGRGGRPTSLPITLSSIPAVAIDYFITRDSYFYKYFLDNFIVMIAICIFLFIFFTIFFTLTSIFIYFALYGFIRILILWILAVIAPIAFSTIIFENSRVYKVVFPGFFKWDKWLEMLLVWSFLIVPMCFIFYMGDHLSPAIERTGLPNAIKNFLGNITIEAGGESQYLAQGINRLLQSLAELIPVLILFIFYALAFSEVKTRIKEQTAVIVGGLASGLISFTGLGSLTAGIGAGALAVGGGLTAGLASGLGMSSLASGITNLSSVGVRGLSLLGGARAQKLAQSAISRSEKIKKGTESAVKQVTTKEGWKQITTAASTGVGTFGGAAIGMLAAGPLGAITGAFLGGSGMYFAGKSKRFGGFTRRTATGFATGAITGSIFGPLGMVIGGFVGGATGGLSITPWGRKVMTGGRKVMTAIKGMVQRPKTKLNELETREKGKLKNGSSTYQTYDQRQVRDGVLKNPKATFAQKFGAYMRLVTPQNEGGLGETPTRDDKKALRESVSSLLTDKSEFKKATNLEKAAAAKILAESDQPLSSEEIEAIRRALPVIDLNPQQRPEDLLFIQKLLAKAPSLASYFGFDKSYAVTQARNQETLTKLPTRELQEIFDYLETDDIKRILESGEKAQKAKIIELTLKNKFKIKVSSEITDEIEKDPSAALTKLFYQLAGADQKKILEDIAKGLDLPKEQKEKQIKKLEELWNRMLQASSPTTDFLK